MKGELPVASILDSRTKSGFPVSIGTGLALETIFDPIEEIYDPDRIVPPKIDKSRFDYYLFNVSTLLRNLITSVTYAQFLEVKKEEVLEVLLDELEFLSEFFTVNNLDIHFYLVEYEEVKRKYAQSLRVAHTQKQIYLAQLTDEILEELKKYNEIELFKNSIKMPQLKRALIFTHIAYDLTNYKNFKELVLLESHTGIIKERKDWYTKYYPLPRRDLSIIPLSKLLLPIFGDHVMFRPEKLHTRLEVYDRLQAKGVSPLTDDFSLKIFLGNKKQ